MRLGYLLSQYPTAGHAFMRREIAKLRGLGWEIDVLAIRPPDASSAQTAEESEAERTTFYVTRSPLVDVLGTHVSVLFSRPAVYLGTLWAALKMGNWHPRATLASVAYFAEAVVVGAWLEKRGSAHVHTHFSSTVGLLVTRLFPVSLSITFHGPEEFDGSSVSRIEAKVNASRFIVAISTFARSQLMRYAPGADWTRIEVVPLGVEAPPAGALRPRSVSRPFRLVCAARLAPVKGHRILVAAMAEIIDAGRDVVLHVAGDGPERTAIADLVRELKLENHVIFEGALDQATLGKLYSRTDAMVLATLAEGVPVVLMEAMALEVPCVASWVCGVPELIEHDRDGLLVPPGDPVLLARAVQRLMDEPGLATRLGRAGRLKVRDQYNVDANVRRLADVFERRLSLASFPPPATPVRERSGINAAAVQ